MRLKNFSIDRSLWSYDFVQKAVSGLIRDRRFQVRKIDFAAKPYLDLGCGPDPHSNFINLEYFWRPGIDLCCNLRNGLPLPDASVKGVFTEHCMEHFSFQDAESVFRECCRVLVPRGLLRVVVPDIGKYISVYHRRISGDSSVTFPFQEFVKIGGLKSPLAHVNRIYYHDRDSPSGHCCMYDDQLLAELLSRAGFTDIRRETFLSGRNPDLLIDSQCRAEESLYVEAMKPGN